MSSNPIQLKPSELDTVRQELLKKQNNKCILCERDFAGDLIACVDHDHVSGHVRAVLCTWCNANAGKIEQRANRAKQNLTSMAWLMNFYKYITADHTNYLHPSEIPKKPKVKKTSFNKMIKLFKEKYPKKKVPDYPKSGTLTKSLEKLFEEFNIEDVHYKD